MEINQIKPIKVNAKTVSIHCKVSDCFTYAILDQQGDQIYDQEDGYVPDFMPGNHYGDYIILDIDIDTGIVKNWKKLTPKDVENVMNKGEDD